MGIHGLWPLLEPTATSITLDVLEGKRLAIDISFWLHQASQSYLNTGDGPDAKYPHLTLLIRRIAKLLFYKIRPVFVFDGADVPVFKRQVLRDRALKRHLDDILTNDRNQKRILEQIARVNPNASDESFEDVGKQIVNAICSPKKKTRRSNDDDLFALPSTSFSQGLTSVKTEPAKYDYMEGYESLRTSDARVNFLKEAKEKCRLARLRSDEIPNDSKDFSDFQLKRLINRNRINTQLDMIRRDKLKQSVQVFENNTKMVVVDNQLRSHVLLHNEDVQVINPERDARERMVKESLTWPAFLRQMEEAKADEQRISSVDEDVDDALQEAILASVAECNGLTDKGYRQLSEAGFRIADAYEDNWSSSDEDDIVERNDKDGCLTRNEKQNVASNCSLDVDYMSDSSSSSLSSGRLAEISVLDNEMLEDGNEEDYFRPKTVGSSTEAVDEEPDERSIYAECQTLLSCLGIPYLCAPGEAEAQCVELERLGLVDAIVSDDSDVWLFGARCVYKNMFSHSKHVQEYRSTRILDFLGLSRSEFIQIGMLSGGDYTAGFHNIGVVTALELISEFLSVDSTKTDDPSVLLKKIGNWLRTPPKSLLENERIDRNDKSYVESKSRIRFRKVIEASNDKAFIDLFPNEKIFEAYAKPKVNSSDQRFTWNQVKFDSLAEFLWTKIGWRLEKLNQVTHGAFQKWNEFVQQTSRQYQSRIDAFINRNAIVDTAALAPTFRVQMALAKLKGKKDVDNESVDDEEEIDMQIAQAAAIACSSTRPAVSKTAQTASKSRTTKRSQTNNSRGAKSTTKKQNK